MLRDEHKTVAILHRSQEYLQQPGIAVVLEPAHSDLQELRDALLPLASADPVPSSLLVNMETDLLPGDIKNVTAWSKIIFLLW